MTIAFTESFHTPFVTRDHVAEKEAFVCAALGRMRRAIQYRKLAEEYAEVGRLTDYRRCVREAESSRKRAWDALSYARLEAAYHGQGD